MADTTHPRPALKGPVVRRLAAAGSLACLAGILPVAAQAAPIIPSDNFGNEVNYLEFTIDHHFSALRLTELAAGTSVVGSSSGFAGSTETFPSTAGKGTDPVVLSVATTANAAQRREILQAQGFLETYYGISGYQPFVLPMNQPQIATLDQAAPGDPFNIAFLQTFSEHHAELLQPSLTCESQAPHADVRAYCTKIHDAQVRQINEMQTELRNRYGISDGIGTTVPEPSGLAVFAAALAGLGFVQGWRKSLRGKVA